MILDKWDVKPFGDNGGGDVALQADGPNSPVRWGEDAGCGRGGQPRDEMQVGVAKKRKEKPGDPFDFKKWTVPTGRHDAPSPQSPVRGSRTRSFGFQLAARPEGPPVTGSSPGHRARRPAASWRGHGKNGVFHHECFGFARARVQTKARRKVAGASRGRIGRV